MRHNARSALGSRAVYSPTAAVMLITVLTLVVTFCFSFVYGQEISRSTGWSCDPGIGFSISRLDEYEVVVVEYD